MSVNPENVQNLVYFYQWLLALVRYDDLNKLVTSANTRHAPLFAIVAFTDFRTCLERAATYLENVSAGISSFQHGGGTSDKKKEKRGNKNTNKVNKKSVSYSDKKDSKKDKDTCDLISISYKGQSDSVEAYRKLTHVIPWYEYCLYVFRHELMISECRAKGIDVERTGRLDYTDTDEISSFPPYAVYSSATATIARYIIYSSATSAINRYIIYSSATSALARYIIYSSATSAINRYIIYSSATSAINRYIIYSSATATI
eukprot:gene23466-17293_t